MTAFAIFIPGQTLGAVPRIRAPRRGRYEKRTMTLATAVEAGAFGPRLSPMSTLPATAPVTAGGLPTTFLIADDARAGDEAAELLRDAGFPVQGPTALEPGEGRRWDGALLVLILWGDAGERVEAIGAHAGRRLGAKVLVTMPTAAAAGLLRRALHAGADGIVFDRDVDRALVATARAIAAGQLVVPLALRRQIAPRPLSYREKQILSFVVLGYTNRQIADKLFLAESTVKTHLSSVFEKLDARSRAEAAALALDPDTGYGLTLPSVSTPSAA
jgi:DNA-binding NarL/FixJ family response regulator